MGRILGASLATIAAATVTVPAISAEYSDYNYELEKDRQAAATAELFIENLPEFRADISSAVIALEAEYNAELEEIPSECRMFVLDQEPSSIEDINIASTCDYDKEQTKDARRILESTLVKKENLIEYLEGGGFSDLESDIEDANTVIDDANNSSVFDDLTDYTYGPIAVEINENGELIKNYYGAGRELDPLSTFSYTVLAFGAALVGAAIGNKINRKKTISRSRANYQEKSTV